MFLELPLSCFKHRISAAAFDAIRYASSSWTVLFDKDTDYFHCVFVCAYVVVCMISWFTGVQETET